MIILNAGLLRYHLYEARMPFFGDLVDGRWVPEQAGTIAEEQWKKLERISQH